MLETFINELHACKEFHDRLQPSVRESDRLGTTLHKFKQLYEQAGRASFNRNNFPAHFTASACLVSVCSELTEDKEKRISPCVRKRHTRKGWARVSFSESRPSVLLTKHKKLGKWLQLGGHIAENENPDQAAYRECSEESGLAKSQIRPLVYCGKPIPIDADIHQIPGHKAEPPHFHYDLRYVFFTSGAKLIQASDESAALAWVPFEDVFSYSGEESLNRLIALVQAHLERQEQESS